ncbi:hypothetical protein BX666DRAFT_1977149 [Dichotomocladium elegans]|nr:hypothetical protein BX666DRAFT_1977149 [Dichotomocladium elegans]
MTHLSDYSFLQRATSLVYLYVWYLYRVYTLDRFQCFRLSRFRTGELKSIVSICLLTMIPCQLYYDIVTTKIKYEEGYANILGHIITKPDTMWTEADKALVAPTDYSLCVGFSFQTGSLLLLQCFWNYLADSVANRKFMSSKEFKLYIVWTVMSMIIFPVLQFICTNDQENPTSKEVLPQLVYGIVLLFISVLGYISHRRFKKLITNTHESNNARSITHRIQYFKELNLLLTIVVFVDAIAFIILSADGLTGPKYLNAHKFSADFLVCNINVTSVITWFIVILILHPKPISQQPLARGPRGSLATASNRQDLPQNSAARGSNADFVQKAITSQVSNTSTIQLHMAAIPMNTRHPSTTPTLVPSTQDYDDKYHLQYDDPKTLNGSVRTAGSRNNRSDFDEESIIDQYPPQL